MAAGLRLLCLFGAISLVLGDCYLHNPRGSNNRLNERSANRDNANRMFDSQVSVAASCSAPVARQGEVAPSTGLINLVLVFCVVYS